MRRPAIGITCSFQQTDPPNPRLQTRLNAAYSDAVFAAGGLPRPIALPAEPEPSLLDDLLSGLDGVIFSGGLDLDPQRYGQTRHPKAELMHERRDRFELALFRRADEPGAGISRSSSSGTPTPPAFPFWRSAWVTRWRTWPAADG